MSDDEQPAVRLLHLFERLRPQVLGPALSRLHMLELSPSHLRVLRSLHHGQALAMKDLADQLCIKPPSLTALTRRLVATGLVARRPHTEDSRVVLVELTAEGQALYAALYAEQLERMRSLLKRLSLIEQAHLLDLLERALESQP